MGYLEKLIVLLLLLSLIAKSKGSLSRSFLVAVDTFWSHWEKQELLVFCFDKVALWGKSSSRAEVWKEVLAAGSPSCAFCECWRSQLVSGRAYDWAILCCPCCPWAACGVGGTSRWTTGNLALGVEGWVEILLEGGLSVGSLRCELSCLC